MVEDGVAPFPEIRCLLVDQQIGLLLRHATTCHHQLLHSSNILLHFGCKEQRCRGDWVRVHAGSLGQVDHAVPHEESV